MSIRLYIGRLNLRYIYMLGKLRYLIDKSTALLIYKQAILPYFDYWGFLLVSCNQGQRKDLRICLRYSLVDCKV